MRSPPALRRVLYISRSRDGEAGHQALIADILRASRRNNAQLGVTGALVYSDRRFAQVLEGDADAVDAVFETIQCDPRHDQIIVLDVASPKERVFADWSMACAEAPALTEAELDAPDAARLMHILSDAIRNTEGATAA